MLKVHIECTAAIAFSTENTLTEDTQMIKQGGQHVFNGGRGGGGGID